MNQLFPPTNLATPPPQQNSTAGRGAAEIPILTLLKECYLLWHKFFIFLPRHERQTLGVRIDNLLIDILETAFTAKYAARENKLAILQKLSRELDNIKFFTTLLWEAKGIDAGKYGQLSQKLSTAGRMLGKWMQIFSNK